MALAYTFLVTNKETETTIWGRRTGRAPTMRVAFDQFIFDSELRVLIGDGNPIHLTPKAFELLHLLLERRPRPVAGTEVIDRLWPGCFVGKGSLAGLIHEVRAAFGDDGRSSRYIRTVHRYGYVFCRAVTPAPPVGLKLAAQAPFRLVTPQGEFTLEEDETSIGRSRDCRVVIGCPTVSRRHARILLIAGQATLEDLHSKNGTFVNGTRIERATHLADGDTIRLGSVPLVYRLFRPESSTDTFVLSVPQQPS